MLVQASRCSAPSAGCSLSNTRSTATRPTRRSSGGDDPLVGVLTSARPVGHSACRREGSSAQQHSGRAVVARRDDHSTLNEAKPQDQPEDLKMVDLGHRWTRCHRPHHHASARRSCPAMAPAGRRYSGAPFGVAAMNKSSVCVGCSAGLGSDPQPVPDRDLWHQDSSVVVRRRGGASFTGGETTCGCVATRSGPPATA